MDNNSQQVFIDGKLAPQIVIDGGYRITVKNKKGEDVEVFIRVVPMSKASQYVSNQLDLAKFVDFICGKRDKDGQYTGEFADTLDDDAVFEIDRRAKEINSPTMDRWIERQAQTVKRMVPQVAPAAVSMNSLPSV